MDRKEITPEIKHKIDICKANGHGWAKFAQNVENQGWVSDRQEATLHRMVLRISIHDRKRGSWGPDVTQWDDHNIDAMTGGYDSNDY